jgi:hypothetical protein
MVVPFEIGFTLRPAFNDYFIRFGRGGLLAPVLLSVPVAALFGVSISALLGTHIYGAALYVSYARKGVKLSMSGRKIVMLAGAYFLAAIAILTTTVLVMKPSVQARFDAIYEMIVDQRFFSPATLRVRLMNVNLQHVLTPCGAIFSLIATAALLQWHNTTLYRRWRAILSGFCILAIAIVGYRWTQLAAWHPPSSWHVIDDSAVEALQASKDDPGIILTNDLRTRPDPRLSRTLMNAWAPQLFGQQFYASNFMYVTFASPDALDRLHAQEWFWSAPVGEGHCGFLAKHDIKYLLIRRDMPFQTELLNVLWLHIVLENADYYLLRVIPRLCS